MHSGIQARHTSEDEEQKKNGASKHMNAICEKIEEKKGIFASTEDDKQTVTLI